MDWMEWSFLPPSTGGFWPPVPEELNDALALTTALGYGLFACEACRLNYSFNPVSISSGFRPPRPSEILSFLLVMQKSE